MNHRRVLAASVLALLASTSLGASERRLPPRVLQRTDTPLVRAALEILDPPRLRGQTVEEAAIELGQLGEGAIQSLFAILAGTLDGPPFTSTLEDDPSRGSVPNEDAIVLRALKRMSPSAVASQVALQATGEAGIDVRRVALRVLGEVCGADGVDAWFAILSEVESVHLTRAYFQGPCEEALGRMLARDPDGFVRVAARTKDARDELFDRIVAGCAASGRPRAVDVLVAALGRDTRRDLGLLRHIGALGSDALGTISEEGLSWVRPYLDDEDPRVRREACVALGRLGDFRAHAALVARLSDADRPTTRAAHWALVALSGRSIERDAQAWSAYFDAEMDWYERTGAGHVAALASDDAHACLAAAGTLVEHPLFRHDSAAAIGALVDRADPVIAAGACAALGALDSRVALDPLLRALARPEEEVSIAAWQSLRRLTDLALPRDPDEWRSVLRRD